MHVVSCVGHAQLGELCDTCGIKSQPGLASLSDTVHLPVIQLKPCMAMPYLHIMCCLQVSLIHMYPDEMLHFPAVHFLANAKQVVIL